MNCCCHKHDMQTPLKFHSHTQPVKPISNTDCVFYKKIVSLQAIFHYLEY